eukprot:SAG22_NODE_14902_length_362_cov_0.638783_1_plen_120_part_11
MGGATLNGQPIPMYLEYGSNDPDMIARTKNLSDYAHSRGMEFWLYKGDQASHFNWTEDWMEIQDAAQPPSHGWPTGNGFCPSSQWGGALAAVHAQLPRADARGRQQLRLLLDYRGDGEPA